ncbi:hypothetical protein OG488_29465 [Streptomyces sp. NBC_01460]|uniref:hypothetical protein n=1 Tax=Streptomyces sp. NBC_01460 TaxID=2903875 RepID=UPI002E3212C9|nr:hypothetical protein [Streptomyces sp. NBC_01460]
MAAHDVPTGFSVPGSVPRQRAVGADCGHQTRFRPDLDPIDFPEGQQGESRENMHSYGLHIAGKDLEGDGWVCTVTFSNLSPTMPGQVPEPGDRHL